MISSTARSMPPEREQNQKTRLCCGYVHTAIHSIIHLIEENAHTNAGLPLRFCASKIVEGEEGIMNDLAPSTGGTGISSLISSTTWNLILIQTGRPQSPICAMRSSKPYAKEQSPRRHEQGAPPFFENRRASDAQVFCPPPLRNHVSRFLLTFAVV